MSANIIFVHDDPEFIEEAAAALRLAGHKVVTFREPTLNAVETAPFEILITRVWFPIGQPNGVALARMARLKMWCTPKDSARPSPPRSTYLSLSPRSPRWPQPEEQTLPFF
jgi:hypothetical protein